MLTRLQLRSVGLHWLLPALPKSVMCGVFPQGSRKEDQEPAGNMPPLSSPTLGGLPQRTSHSNPDLCSFATSCYLCSSGREINPPREVTGQKDEGNMPQYQWCKPPTLLFLLYEETKPNWKNLLLGSWCVCKSAPGGEMVLRAFVGTVI